MDKTLENAQDKPRIHSTVVYALYDISGSLYTVVKVICYCFGFVYFCGVALGFVASLVTVGAGIFAFKERSGNSGRTAHWLAVIFPLLILPLTPTFMLFKLGKEFLEPEKIIVFLIFECLAFAQVILAVKMMKGTFQKGE